MKKLLFLLLPCLVFAAIDDSIKKIEQFNQQKEIYKELQDNKKNKFFQYDMEEPALLKKISKNCIYVKIIVDKDITLLSEKEKSSIYAKYIHKCNTAEELKNLTTELTSIYFKKGYITSRVYLVPQNLKEGEVKLYAIEGKINDILPHKLYLQNAFFTQQNSYLNIRDIESSLEIINRLPSNHATMRLLPAKKVGFSDIYVENNTSKRFHGSLGINNFGLDTTGKIQGYLLFNLDNPLKINDQISINLNSTQNHFKEENSKGDSLSYSFPLGKLMTTLRLKDSKYKQLIPTGILEYESNGETKTYELNFKYKFFHNRNNRFNIGTTISQSRTKNYLANTLLEMSSYNLSKIAFNVDYFYQISGLYIFLSLSHTQGTHWFDDYNPTDLDEKYTLENFTLYLIKDWKGFQYSINGYFQYTKDQLFNASQISIGGAYSVRGYQKEGLSGNRGYYLRNELSKQLSNKIFHKISQTYFISLDNGWIKKEEDTNGGSLFSYAIGTRFQYKDFNAEVYFSSPLYRKDVSFSQHFIGFDLAYNF